MSSPTLLNPAGSWHLQQQQNARQQSVASVSDRCSAIFAGRSVAGCRHSCSLPLPVTPCRGSVSAAGAREHSVIDFTPSERQVRLAPRLKLLLCPCGRHIALNKAEVCFVQVPLFSCVEDVMTKTHIHTCRPYTTIDDGMPHTAVAILECLDVRQSRTPVGLTSARSVQLWKRLLKSASRECQSLTTRTKW